MTAENFAALCLSTLALSAHPASAALVFTDPSFENGGSTTQVDDTNYNEYGKGNNPVSTYPAGIWNQWLINDGDKGGLLEDKDGHQGFTTVPAGVSGEQFFTYGRGSAGSIFQYVNDGAATTGQVTFSIDYWAHENDTANPLGGNGDILLEIIAFNDPDTPIVNMRDDDPVTGTGFITSGDTWTTVNVADAATGFQTLQATLDLGTGYQYVGVIIGHDNFDKYTDASGVVVSFDNLQVQPVPEPSAFTLIGLAGIGLVLRRRRK